jgi:phosphoribosylformylglycinamidine cyclo-ligase
MAHVTGGGFDENIPRVVPKGLEVVIKSGAWPVPAIFRVIERAGEVSFEEMHRVFNMGIGMVVFASPDDVGPISRIWSQMNQRWYAIGNVRPGDSRVVIEASR